MKTETIGFSSEEEREKYIGGSREKRIQVELSETETALSKLEDLSQLINEKTKKITDFYLMLEDKLRSYEIGYPFILKAENNEIEDNKYRLNYFEDILGQLFFWRLGFAKLSTKEVGNWYIVAHMYKVEKNDADRIEGPELKHVWLPDQTVRLTYASRDLRIAAAHVISDFTKKFLKQVSYNENVIDCALKRVEKLQSLISSKT